MPDALPIHTALLSVSDKRDLVPFARRLHQHGARLVSTGGTARALREAGFEVTAIEQLTGFSEMMDGRVKTLHPNVHGGLLALRDEADHAAALKQHQITPIDLVCVNLYPFERTVADPDVAEQEAIENIDIGGPSMIRSAAKNHRYVACVTHPKQYDEVSSDMDANEGRITYRLRRTLAAAAFACTAAYDQAIAQWMANRWNTAPPEQAASRKL
jgi:phosphoribosylaminoimidazolecarboxamide formyltransferase/IMP cyclohydrolase